MRECYNRNICFETGKVMGKKEARGFATGGERIDRIYVIAKRCPKFE